MGNIIEKIFGKKVPRTNQFGIVIVAKKEEDFANYKEEVRVFKRYPIVVKHYFLTEKAWEEISPCCPVKSSPLYILIQEGIYSVEALENRLADPIFISGKPTETLLFLEKLNE